LASMPMGTPLIQIFDHLVFGRGCGRWESKDGLRELKREVLMWGAASWSVCGVAVGPPVITRLPLTVHLMATSWTCGGVIAASSLLRALQSISGFTWSSFLMPRVAKSTSRLRQVLISVTWPEIRRDLSGLIHCTCTTGF